MLTYVTFEQDSNEWSLLEKSNNSVFECSIQNRQKLGNLNLKYIDITPAFEMIWEVQTFVTAVTKPFYILRMNSEKHTHTKLYNFVFIW